jgi:hypothetical protein
MNKLILSVVTTGIMLAGMQVFAGDLAKDASSKQQWNDCLARQVAKNDGSSKSQMKKSCKDEMKTSTTSSNSTTNGTSADSSTTNATAPRSAAPDSAAPQNTTPTQQGTDSSTINSK